ncbi:MAG TPA: hypothetical protein PLE24_16135, partial [Chitinispirillaceae bacterium]|nr:hypothetical protein [Chitinispirillaceae bacterium]
PESHDTDRLASEYPGTIEAQKGRYAFEALFSKGLMMTMGFEYGAKTRMDVVKGSPEHVDKPQWDLTQWIRIINDLKMKIPVLGEEGTWRTLCDYNQPFLFLRKDSDSGNKPVCVCVNKNLTGETTIEEWMIPPDIKNCSKAITLTASKPAEEPVPKAFMLEPADVVLFM